MDVCGLPLESKGQPRIFSVLTCRVRVILLLLLLF